MSDELDWFDGELKLCECDDVLWQYPPFTNTPLNGLLILTNFRLRFIPDNFKWDSSDSDLRGKACLESDNRLLKKHDIVLYNIDSIFNVKKKKRKRLLPGCLLKKKVTKLEIVCKTFQMVGLGLEAVEDTDLDLKLVYTLIEASRDSNIDPFLSHSCLSHDNYKDDERNLESYWEGMLRRTGELNYRVVSCNEAFHVTDSLPKSFAVPSSLSPRDVVQISPKFVDNRFPFWCYSYPPTHTSLVRMACKVASVQEDVEDKIYRSVRASHPSREFPQIFNLNSLFPPYNEIYHAYLSLQALCVYDASKDSSSDHKWLSQMEASNWLSLVVTCLTTSQKIATCMSLEKLSVVIKEWNSSVLSPVISCLVQLMLDASVRQREAFEEMVCREWLCTSGRFAFKHQSSSFSTPCNSRSEVDSCQFPVFLLFLDCVFQLVTLAPTQFSFNATFLQSLWTTVCCGLYRDLLFNSAKELYYNSLHLQKHSFDLGTLRRHGKGQVLGTLMRKSQLDFSTLRRQKKDPMHESYYGGVLSQDGDSASLKKGQAAKSSLLSLNNPGMISKNQVRKQSLMTLSSPEQTFFFADHRLEKKYPQCDLFGTHPTSLAANLWDWRFIFEESQLKLFDNIEYLASLCFKNSMKEVMTTKKLGDANNATLQITSNISTSRSVPSRTNHSNTSSKPPPPKSALIINGLKVYNYSSFAQFDASKHNVFFLQLDFSLPFLTFWSECYLKYHPFYYHHNLPQNNPLMTTGQILPDDQFDSANGYQFLNNIRKRLFSLEKCLQEDDSLAS